MAGCYVVIRRDGLRLELWGHSRGQVAELVRFLRNAGIPVDGVERGES